MTLRFSVGLIILAIALAGLLASHQHKQNPMMIEASAAKHPAVMMVCNPVFVPDGKPVRKVQQV